MLRSLEFEITLVIFSYFFLSNHESELKQN